MNCCIVIDPFSLAYPTENNNSVKFEEYIERILDLKKISSISNLKLLISRKTSEILLTENNYPNWDCLKDTLNEIGLTGIIQPRDIMSTIEGLLKSTEFEEFININEILYDNLTYETSILDGRGQVYKDELEKLFLLYLLNSRLNNKENLLASVKDLKFDVAGTLLEVESSSNLIITLPEELTGEVTTFSDRKSVV